MTHYDGGDHEQPCTCIRCDLATARARIAELEKERDELRRQLTFQSANNHLRNVELDALKYVWCDGGCSSGVHRYAHGELTEEVVAAAERNTRRLRQWLGNATDRAARYDATHPKK